MTGYTSGLQCVFWELKTLGSKETLINLYWLANNFSSDYSKKIFPPED